MFYTKKAGLKPNGVRKLKQTGVIAIEIDDINEIHWSQPDQVDWISKHDEIGIMFLRAVSALPGGDDRMGKLLMGAIRRRHGVNPDGTLAQAKAKPTT